MNDNTPVRDYTHRAKKKNKTDIVFSVCAYLSAAVLYLSSVFVPGIKYVPVLQFCALAAIVTAVYINQRHTWLSFIYGIIPEENKNTGDVTGANFVIYRVQGKRQTCLVKIDVRDCLKLIHCTHNDDHKSELADLQSPEIYNYCATMCPAEYCRAVFRADGGIAVIAFEPDEVLTALLHEFAAMEERSE